MSTVCFVLKSGYQVGKNQLYNQHTILCIKNVPMDIFCVFKGNKQKGTFLMLLLCLICLQRTIYQMNALSFLQTCGSHNNCKCILQLVVFSYLHILQPCPYLYQGSRLTLANPQNKGFFDNVPVRKISTSKHLRVRIMCLDVPNIWK